MISELFMDSSTSYSMSSYTRFIPIYSSSFQRGGGGPGGGGPPSSRLLDSEMLTNINYGRYLPGAPPQF